MQSQGKIQLHTLDTDFFSFFLNNAVFINSVWDTRDSLKKKNHPTGQNFFIDLYLLALTLWLVSQQTDFGLISSVERQTHADLSDNTAVLHPRCFLKWKLWRDFGIKIHFLSAVPKKARTLLKRNKILHKKLCRGQDFLVSKVYRYINLRDLCPKLLYMFMKNFSAI